MIIILFNYFHFWMLTTFLVFKKISGNCSNNFLPSGKFRNESGPLISKTKIIPNGGYKLVVLRIALNLTRKSKVPIIASGIHFFLDCADEMMDGWMYGI